MMKLYLLAVLLALFPLVKDATSHQLPVAEAYSIKSQIEPHQSEENKTITDETLRKLMEAAKTFLNFNTSFANVTFNQIDDLQIINASLPQTSVLGLNSFDVVYVKSNMEDLQFLVTIHFPVINVTGYYNLLVDNKMLTIFGNGPISVNVTNLTAALNITLKEAEDKYMEMKDFVVIVTINETKVWLYNLEGGGEASKALNDLINEVLPEILTMETSNLRKMAKKIVIKKTKNILNNVTLKGLIDLIYLIINE